MRILVATDKFKGSLTAQAACQAIANALAEVAPQAQPDLCPLTDGGDGFATVLAEACNGILAGEEVRDPLGRPTQAQFGIVKVADIPEAALRRLGLQQLEDDAQIAIIEMASASGLVLLGQQQRDPWQTHTAGTGELIAAAIRLGVAAIVIGLGGSATNDLGLGALGVLGLKFLDDSGVALPSAAPANWHWLARIEGKPETAMPELRIACDVTNPLLGDNGAAAVYAPQKGLKAEDLPRLEAQSKRVARLLCKHTGANADALLRLPGTGAAGGICFGLMCAFGSKARIVSGFDLVADWLQLHERLQSADRVITGEGRFDESSLSGKGPGTLVQAALAAGKPVDVFAGSISAHEQAGLCLHPITPAGMPLEQAMAEAESLLNAAVKRVFAHAG